MTETAIVSLLYILALVGMTGVWLIPTRLWSVVVTRRIGVSLTARPDSLIAATALLIATVFSCFVAAATLPGVLRCLENSMMCSANRAMGLLKLAAFGMSVVVVEGVWLGSRLVLGWRRRAGAQA